MNVSASRIEYFVFPSCSKSSVFMTVDRTPFNEMTFHLPNHSLNEISFAERSVKRINHNVCGKMARDHEFSGGQKQSFFNCLLDMAALEKTGGSRTGSVSIEGHEATNSQTHLLIGQQNGGSGSTEGDHLNGSLAVLARRTTMRKRSVK